MSTTGSNAGSDFAMSTTDGITWTRRILPPARWHSVMYGNGVIVATGIEVIVSALYAICATSTDGITWTKRPLPKVSDSFGNQSKGAFGNGVFLVTYTVATYVSADGINWFSKPVLVSSYPGNIAYGAGVFIQAITNTNTNICAVVYAENATNSEYMYLSGTAGKYVRVK